MDACSTTEDVPRSTIRQKRAGDLNFLPRSSGRLENYDSSDLITAAKGSAQRSMSLGALRHTCGHKERRSTSAFLASGLLKCSIMALQILSANPYREDVRNNGRPGTSSSSMTA